MELFTRVDTPKAGFEIDYTSRIAFFGSCFADNISAQFAARKFSVLANPFGTVYNPVSIARQIRAIADGKVFGENDVFKDERCDGLWHSWDAHSSLSASTREECIAKLNAATAQARDFLRKADAVFITLGTAFVYYLKDSGMPVSNCHRQDPNLFTRRMISVEEAASAICEIVENLRKIKNQTRIASPSARNDVARFTSDNTPRIVFTVSPLRHMGDGAHNNTLSKATLQLAINKALEEANATYFPSYEIVMDELRDYRFYADDMVHLSKTAEEYIFKQMTETYCDSTTRENMAKVEKFLKMANHRIQDESSPATQQLKKKIASQAAELEKQIPGLSLR
ncbi:GSCFA family protein [Fibrobacter sp. UWOV1]|uniref:GSCFA domain-containing protein n=1 Tax=Fibrobacter sp. UWOV1 TaxID=1896215 RepID=UPI000913E88F|nr:GSCFA domain-containing protein [Fibrobacter sp. UWOV1]SHL57684.1 GSCFA family protein [Fibrobacter sp. UWOV1]